MPSFTLLAKAETLERMSRQLLFPETDIYSDDFCRLNREVLSLSDALYLAFSSWDILNLEEASRLSLSLLMGYNATIYDSGNKYDKKEIVLNRCLEVLPRLSASPFKLCLLTFCYGEVYEEALSKEAEDILSAWQGRELSKAERETVDFLRCLQNSPCPYLEVLE